MGDAFFWTKLLATHTYTTQFSSTAMYTCTVHIGAYYSRITGYIQQAVLCVLLKAYDLSSYRQTIMTSSAVLNDDVKDLCQGLKPGFHYPS